MGARLSPELAARFVSIALGHVQREYPNKLDHVLAGDGDALLPRALHPIFYGSFDWHSCVHGYWMLARLRRLFPETAPAVTALFDTQITPGTVAGELAYLSRPTSRGFERPYGWAWLLALQAELALQDEPRWAEAMAPLAAAFADRFRAFLPKATYPIRVGTHFSGAFALAIASDYARAHDAPLLALFEETAHRWFGQDVDCPAWGEPGGDEFLSGTLIEAECMRRLLPIAEFRPWRDQFLPRLLERQPATLFTPATVSDRSDGKIAHLDGLNLSRAWCFRGLATSMAEGDARRAVLEEAAKVHLAEALPHVAGDYMGEHWLASFATLALEG
ncbi:DUF2891 domain-containing protein [Acetobacteraceae bacterium H6797]|nr:DUF2891 domain-containing protein [Acetobacteraceae bacterium H6797]